MNRIRWLNSAIMICLLKHGYNAQLDDIPCQWHITIIDGDTWESVEDKLVRPSSSANYSSGRHFTPEITSLNNRTTIDYDTARKYLRRLPQADIANITGLIYRNPALYAFGLDLLLEVRCAGSDGGHLQQRHLHRLLQQRHLPEVSVRGVSTRTGPTELLMQAVPVRRRPGEPAAFIAPLPVVAAQLTVQTAGTPLIRPGLRRFNLAPSGSGGEPPAALAALDLSCLGGRARAAVAVQLGARLSRLQSVRLLPPQSSELWTDGAAPRTVLAGYQYLAFMVLTEFLEREQLQVETHDALASPLQRFQERARLVDDAARYFFARNQSVYVPADSYAKVAPSELGSGQQPLPPLVYLDHGDTLLFEFTAPTAAAARLVTDRPNLLSVSVDSCHTAGSGWRSCSARVQPQPGVRLAQQTPGANMSWAELRAEAAAGACRGAEPEPLRVAVGCPPSRTLVFNFTSTFQRSGLGDKCPRCLCDQGVPCLLYSDVFRPQLSLVDWTSYRSQPYTGNYTLDVIGEGFSAASVGRYDAARQRRMSSLLWRIWEPSVADEEADVDQASLNRPVFRNVPESAFDGISWHCDQYSDCPSFLRLRFSTGHVETSTFCRHQVEVVVQLYGVPTNTFVDVFTMSGVYCATLLISLVYTCWLTHHIRKVAVQKKTVVDILYPASG